MAPRVTATSSFTTLPEDPYIHFTMTQLDLTDTQTAFDQGKQAYATQNYTHAIEYYTKALNTLHHNLESVILLHRAVAYEKSQHYQKALDDCAQADNSNQHQFVSRPDLYWIKASSLLRQGRLREATDTYKKGADAMSEQIFPGQKELLMKQHKQCNQQLKEIDYQNQMLVRPFEILSRILSALPWQAQGRLALTCRFWYRFIFQEWPEFGSCIDVVSDDTLPKSTSSLTQLLKHIQPHHVKTVKLDFEEDTEQFESKTVIDHLIENRWNKVETLVHLNGSRKKFKTVLHLNKDSIKKLELMYYEYPKECTTWNVPLYSGRRTTYAIQICNNLETIISIYNIHEVDFQEAIKTSLTVSNWFPTDICITDSTVLNTNLLTEIFNRTPFLISFRLLLLEKIPVDVIRDIYDHAPQLQHLVVSPNVMGRNPVSTTYKRSRPEHPTVVGLRSLTLGVYDDEHPSEFDCIYALLFTRSHHSLEFLDMVYRDARFVQKSFTALAKLGTPNLQKLRMEFYPKGTVSSPEVLSQFLLACPALENIQLEMSTYVWSDHFYQALGKLQNLTHLDLRLTNATDRMEEDEASSSSSSSSSEIQPVTDDDLYNSVTAKGSLALFENTNSFWSLSIVCNFYAQVDQAKMNMITSIGRCGSLRKLEICSLDFENEQLVEFLESIKSSNIHTFTIRSPTRPLGEKELKALGSLQHLECLTINDDEKKNFDKPKLFRLFQEHRIDLPLIVHYTASGHIINGWKQLSSSLTSIDKVECLHKRYSIQEVYDACNNTTDDEINIIPFKMVYCKECECEHFQHSGHDDVNEVYYRKNTSQDV